MFAVSWVAPGSGCQLSQAVKCREAELVRCMGSVAVVQPHLSSATSGGTEPVRAPVQLAIDRVLADKDS